MKVHNKSNIGSEHGCKQNKVLEQKTNTQKQKEKKRNKKSSLSIGQVKYKPGEKKVILLRTN